MDKTVPSRTTGLIIGKFMPPHKGHKYLIDFARNYVDELNVLVCSIRSEPIPGKERYGWMKEMFPDVNIKHLDDELPQEPSEHPNFWNMWKESIRRKVTDKIDYVFASEDYGTKLSEILNAKYIPVDVSRTIVPMSGTKIRNDPITNWDYILESARPYFAKRVCIFGPESTGKSTLAKKLAEHFNTVNVTEYAREYLNPKDGKCNYEDIEFIAKGQIASEEALVKQANKVLVCDTDVLTTSIWSNIIFGKCPSWIQDAAEKRIYDLYIIPDVDVPFVPDKQRYGDNKRQLTIEQCKDELEKRNRKYVIINGNWKERFNKSVLEIKNVLEGN